MLDITYLLERGEYQLQHYWVQLTEFANSGWINTAPWLRAYITNRHLILIPESADAEHKPVIIPLEDIVKVWNVGLGRRDGVMLYLNSGERLYMFVGWNQGRWLTRDTREMAAMRRTENGDYTM